jgi:hypothetical protein
MEDLFWTTIPIDGRQAEYHIIFEDEVYRFIPKESSMATYNFRRGHDEWQAVDEQSEKILDIAEEALEKYLMRQH